jgi:hypothetical protein
MGSRVIRFIDILNSVMVTEPAPTRVRFIDILNSVMVTERQIDMGSEASRVDRVPVAPQKSALC